ncbi:MAG: protease complex subunit PrcB family protein [Elusimicrobia bacterium]|nr:protease complex subunit PrcB family protein [Elusimicrobiota bacterium]
MQRGPLPARLGIGLAAGLAGVLVILAARKLTSPPASDFKELTPDILPAFSTASVTDRGYIAPDTSPDPTTLILPDGTAPPKGSPQPPVGILVDADDDPSMFTERALAPVEHVTVDERRARFKAYIEQLKALREALIGDGHRPVPISGNTAKLLAAPPKDAGPLADGEAPAGWSGSYSGSHEAGTRTVSDADAWRKFWTRLSQEPIPRVDFSRHRVAAVFMGHRPTTGFRVEILGASPSPSALVVRYRETVPAPGDRPRETATSPYALLAVPAGPLPVRFKKEK